MVLWQENHKRVQWNQAESDDLAEFD